jgi:hypothetical protein
MANPTFPQMQHFFRLVDQELITSANFQGFLQNPARFLVGFPTNYDQDISLKKLIERAVGPNNVLNINSDITPERFPLKGNGVRTVNARVEPYLDGETSEQAAKRLVAAGHLLGNTADLAGFLHDHFSTSSVSSWRNPARSPVFPRR